MNGDSVSGSTLDLAKTPSGFGESFGWVFQQLRIAFRDLAKANRPERSDDMSESLMRRPPDLPEEHDRILEKLLGLYRDLFFHDGYGTLSVEMRFLKRDQKEILIICGKEDRFVVDAPDSGSVGKGGVLAPAGLLRRTQVRRKAAEVGGKCEDESGRQSAQRKRPAHSTAYFQFPAPSDILHGKFPAAALEPDNGCSPLTVIVGITLQRITRNDIDTQIGG